jgi:hypothetical protein
MSMETMTEHRADIIEAPVGYWVAWCSCGWIARSLSSRTQACEAHHRHTTGKEWWQA